MKITLAAWADFVLTRYARWRSRSVADASGMTWLDLPAGRIRVFDSQSDGPCILFTPDGPNVIEHHLATLNALRWNFRVVCFDMPGFGLSLPSASHTHSLDQGARVVLDVLDALGISSATLAFSCANGFYALRAAQQAPERIDSLFLTQTPSLFAMQAWARRTVPPVLQISVVGQLIGWLVRRRAARSWYRKALPADADAEPFRRIAGHAFVCGACFGLAGVVQALLRESDTALIGVTAPCTLLWGSADRSHRGTSIDSLLTLTPHARILRADHCGHFPDIEQPERYTRLLREHMAELR